MEEQENINTKRNMSDSFEPVLIGIQRTDPSSYIHIDKDEFKIGRGRTNDEIIVNISISRQHCIFKRTDIGEWSIQDVSSNGTFVNGNQLAHKEIRKIKMGDLIQLGQMPEFSYKFDFKSKNEPLAKRGRFTTSEFDMSRIVMEQKTFEESQQMKRNELAEQMKAKHTEQLELKNELKKLLNDRDTALGEKDHLNRQINSLEKNIEEVKEAEMNLEKLNRELSERLDNERREFETKLNDEKKKMQEALEFSRKEKEILENNMKDQLVKFQSLTESLNKEKEAAEKLQSENAAFELKLKQTEDTLNKVKAKANELENTLEKHTASKDPQVSVLGTVAENVEIVDETNLMILDTIDLTVDTPVSKKAAESSSAGSANEEVFNKVGDIMEEQLTCSICSELFVTALTLNCTHTFCQYCINTWMKKKKECPVCRAGITAMNRSLVLDNFIDKMVENLSAGHKKRRTEIVDERRENERLANEAANQGGRRARGRGRPPNANQNQPGNAPLAATSGANTAVNNPGRTQRTDIQHRGPEARNNPDWNYSSGSSDRQHQQPATAGSTSSYDQTPAAAPQSSNDSIQRTADNDETSTWSTATDTDGDTTSIHSSNSNSQTSEDPEGNVTDVEISIDSDTHSTDNSWGDIEYGDENYWGDPSDDDYVDGLPDAFYGGYGSCYSCGARGHWAPGCPFK